MRGRIVGLLLALAMIVPALPLAPSVAAADVDQCFSFDDATTQEVITPDSITFYGMDGEYVMPTPAQETDGSYCFRLGAPHQLGTGWYRVAAAKAGYAPFDDWLNVTGSPIAISMTPDAPAPVHALRISVVDPAGTPLDGVNISLSNGWRGTTTGGVLVLEDMPPGSFFVTASLGGYAQQNAGAAYTYDGGDQAIAVTMAPSTHGARVTVTEADGVTPVSGATVTLASGVSWTTDASGEVQFTGLANGEYGVTVLATDGRTASGTLSVQGGFATIAIALPAPEPIGSTITVTVVDWDGTVPADAWIEYESERYELDANGQAVFRYLPDGRHSFTVKWDDPVRQLSKSVNLSGADVELRFDLGAPVPSYSWALECPVIPAASRVGDVVEIGFAITNTSREATVTDVSFSSRAGSTFTQDSTVLPPGASITGVASIPLLQMDLDRGYVNARIEMEGIRPGNSRTMSDERTNGCVVAEPLNGTVTVVEANGTTPVANAAVTIDGTGFSGATGTDGSVVFENIADGTYQVSVVAPDGRTATGTLTIAGEDGAATIVLPHPARTVAITVTTADRGGAAGGSFALQDAAGTVLHQGNLDANGRAVIQHPLVPGETYTVTAVTEGYRVATQALVAGEGDLAFDLVLQTVGNAKKTIVIAVANSGPTDGSIAVAPEGSTWTLTNTRTGKVYSGEFSGVVPQEIALKSAVGSGTFRVEIVAGPAFEPYTGEVTIRGKSGSLYVELAPVANAG